MFAKVLHSDWNDIKIGEIIEVTQLPNRDYGYYDVRFPLSSEAGGRFFYRNELDVTISQCRTSRDNPIPAMANTDLLPGAKPSNPKDALGIRKVPLHAVPCWPLFELGLAMMEGGRKYGTHNYRAVGVRSSVYYDAVMRHLMAWWEGEDIDPESEVSHIVKAIACLFVLRDSQLMGNCEDDRPVKYPDGLKITELNKIAEDLIKKCPSSANPFTEKEPC